MIYDANYPSTFSTLEEKHAVEKLHETRLEGLCVNSFKPCDHDHIGWELGLNTKSDESENVTTFSDAVCIIGLSLFPF